MSIARFVNSALRQLGGRADEWHRANDGERIGLRLYHLSTCPYCLRVRAAMARLVPRHRDFDRFRTPVRFKHKAPRPQA